MAMFADGDVGDMNHEGYAIQHAQYEVASAMDAPPEITDGDGVDWEGFENWMEDTHGNEDAQLTALKEAGVTDELYQVANGIGNIDPRSYAAEHWGWIRVLDNEAQMLEETQLSSLADGLADAHGEDVENQSFNIETKHAYYTNVPWAVISDGKPADLHEYKSHGSPGWGGHVQNVFCATGEGGGVDPTVIHYRIEHKMLCRQMKDLNTVITADCCIFSRSMHINRVHCMHNPSAPISIIN
jgi:hypothetical protein